MCIATTLLVGETQWSSYIPYIAAVLQQILTKIVLAACSNYCTHLCMRRDQYGMERKKTSEGERNKEKQWKNILPTRAGQVMASYRKNKSVVKLICYWLHLLLEMQILAQVTKFIHQPLCIVPFWGKKLFILDVMR